jgi:hypothetical protein
MLRECDDVASTSQWLWFSVSARASSKGNLIRSGRTARFYGSRFGCSVGLLCLIPWFSHRGSRVRRVNWKQATARSTNLARKKISTNFCIALPNPFDMGRVPTYDCFGEPNPFSVAVSRKSRLQVMARISPARIERRRSRSDERIHHASPAMTILKASIPKAFFTWAPSTTLNKYDTKQDARCSHRRQQCAERSNSRGMAQQSVAPCVTGSLDSFDTTLGRPPSVQKSV